MTSRRTKLLLFVLLAMTGCAAGSVLGGADWTDLPESPAARPPAVHPVSIVEADVFVQKFRTIMRLKCFADDLELLQGVEALPDGTYDMEEIREATEDHGQFLAARILLFDAAGKALAAKVTEVVHVTAPPAGLRQGELMNCFLGFQFEYEYPEPPEFITIRHEMVGEGYLLPSEMKVLLRQAGSDAPNFQMLKPQTPETFRFDWDRPVLNEDASEEDWQAWFDRQRETTLGITSYSSVYSFVYLTPYEVRHEILIPLASLATMLPLERADPMRLEVAEQDRATEDIRKFFSAGNEVRLDGIAVRPVFDRIDYYALDLRDFAVQAERKPVSLANGRVGLILSYPSRSPPREVELTWDLFNDAVQTVDSVIINGEKIEKTQFSTFLASNVWRWQADGSLPALPPITGVSAESLPRLPVPALPLASLVAGIAAVVVLVLRRPAGLGSRVPLAGVLLALAWILWPFFRMPLPVTTRFAPLPAETADSVFRRLHENLFRAFDYYHEPDVYDALAQSVDGPLLRELYLQIRDSLRVREQGGAVARIDDVAIESGGPESPGPEAGDTPGFRYRCTWNLLGTIEHWGHLHQRSNQYDARFEVALRDGQWKIVALEMLDEPIQGVVKTSLRKF